MDVESLVEALCEKGHKCEASTDAGDFICNYIYYQSLRMFHETEVDSIFVHVPSFKTVKKDKQEDFISDLINELSELY